MTEEPLRPLDPEMATFEAHRAELVERARAKFAVVRLGEIAGIFDDVGAAEIAGWRQFGNVPTLVG